MRVFAIVTTLLFLASNAYGQSTTNPWANISTGAADGGTPSTSVNTMPTTAPSTSGSNPWTGTHVMPMPAPTPAMNNASINPSANQGMNAENGAAGTNNAAGAALIAAGMPMLAQPPTMPMGMMLIAMGALALAQGGADSGAAGQSQATYNSSLNGAANTASNPALSQGSGSGAFQQANQALAGTGASMSAAGLTMPNGTVIPPDQIGTQAGMSAAGMSPDQINQVQAKLDSLRGGGGSGSANGPKVASVGVSEGGGGGPASKGNTGTFSFGKFNPFNISSKIKKQMVDGKTVLFDGEPIGVRGQDIFDMIHAAYKKKRDRQNFIEVTLEDEISRAPASIEVARPAAKKKKSH